MYLTLITCRLWQNTEVLFSLLFSPRCYSLSPYLVPPPLISSPHFDSRCFHSFRPGEGVSYVSYHCQPCNYGIWAPRTRLGGPGQGLVCAYRGGPGTTVWAVMWSVSQSTEWQEQPLARQCPQGECVTSRSMSQTFTGSFSASPWHWYVEHLFWHLAAKCKYDKKRRGANKDSFIPVFAFCTQVIIVAVGRWH